MLVHSLWAAGLEKITRPIAAHIRVQWQCCRGWLTGWPGSRICRFLIPLLVL
jgi:hypothetical protein